MKYYNRVLVTDCGSTTTKALLFEKVAGKWRQTYRGEAPTTVEKPIADVTVGVTNAFAELEELSGRPLFKNEQYNNSQDECPLIITAEAESMDVGVDLYLSTSSAGGGLQMVVTGLVNTISAESAERAALGAGAIVMDRLATDVVDEDYEAIRLLRDLRPDMILVAGGYDGGAYHQVIDMVELIKSASPRPRFGTAMNLPLIYAGNREIIEEIRTLWGDAGSITVVGNVRPGFLEESLHEARDAIHELFLSHVMSQSPGYSKLLKWTPVPIMPTPAAVGDMVAVFAEQTGKQVLCADIGGATTDVFSAVRDLDGEFAFNRTVSANLGMSYSIGNVLIEAGIANILRWLPYETTAIEVCDVLRNKMIRPTSIPCSLEELWLEQAVCREALRLSMLQHCEFAVGIARSGRIGGIASVFGQKSIRYQLVNPLTLDVVVGSGGVLSHAPLRLAAALMMIEGFSLGGITELCVDSIFMMPHLGVFSSVDKQAALEIFNADCIVAIAVSVVPIYKRVVRLQVLAEVYINGELVGSVEKGKLRHLPVHLGETVELEVRPLNRDIDVGSGSGNVSRKVVNLGLGGLILDGRNAPVAIDYLTVDNHRQVYRELGLIEEVKQ
jgi:uncharacterized protein (TIGR01319 family)